MGDNNNNKGRPQEQRNRVLCPDYVEETSPIVYGTHYLPPLHTETQTPDSIFLYSVDEEGKLTCPRDNPGAIMSCRCGALFVDIDISQTVSQPVCQDLSILSPIFWSDHIAACA